MILDVGCGITPLGDVNCDISLKDNGVRSGSSKAHKLPIQPKTIDNFVICSAEKLPFRDSAFQKSVSRHVIEHLDHPIQMLKEIIRVTSNIIEIYCPHKLGDRLWANTHLHQKKVEFHQGFFNKSWFYNAAKFLNISCRVSYSNYLYLPANQIPFGFRLPLELHIILWKRIKNE